MCHSSRRGYGCHSRRSNRNHMGLIPVVASFIAGRVSARSAVPIAAPAISQPLAPQVNGRTYRDIDNEKAPQASGQVYRHVDEQIKSAPPAYEKVSTAAVADEKDIDLLNAHFDRGMRMDQPTVMLAVYDQPSGSFSAPQLVQAAELSQPMTWWEEKLARKQEKWTRKLEKRTACHQKKEGKRLASLQRKAERYYSRYEN